MMMQRTGIRTMLAAIAMNVFTIAMSAATIEEADSLNNQNLVLSEPVEFHITNTVNAMVNSTVQINNADAWLFFDNIRPSDVMAQYKSFIFIGDEVLNPGVNGRVAIYGHGVVIMPHGSGYKPLTVYKEKDFSGDENSYAVHTYYTSLGEFDNAIQSFKLKRGYMATFANGADGSGYSRVFIADDADMEINLPGLLSGKVSFIRVFKHNWVNKKGKAGWNPDDINATSYYDWNIGGGTSVNHEYAAIRQNGGWPSWSAINGKQDISHLLGFNEPDRPDQSNMTMDDMIGQWPNFMKSGLRIGSPAWSSEWNSVPNGGNLFDFMNKCDELNYRVDFVAVHCYWVKSPQQWYNDLKYIHERTGRPLWITEWNNGANWTTESWPSGNRSYTPANAEKQLNDIKGILEVLDTASFVERYFIYDWVEDCRKMIYNGQLTPAGQYYHDNTSEMAFMKNKAVIPHWKVIKPEIMLNAYPSLGINLVRWSNPNGELADVNIVERKLNDGVYEEIYRSFGNDPFPRHIDSIDENISGSFVYRIKTEVSDGSVVYSDLATFYRSYGANEFQAANLTAVNFNSASCQFINAYETDPCVILGPITYNNRTAQLTARVEDITMNNAEFNMSTWAFQNLDESDLKSENMSLFALPAGSYDFNGIMAKAGQVENVNGAWKAVSFAEPFETAPVVFATQVSDNTGFPTSIKINNVTTTGFSVRIAKEAGMTGTIQNETVSFFAATPGQGTIGNMPVTVGLSDSQVGDLTRQVEIGFDESYSVPAIFAALQTANDNITSSLRYFHRDANHVRVFKQRETSTTTLPVSRDDLGYMVIDMSANVNTSVPAKALQSQLKAYPNPVKETLYFDDASKKHVQVYDLLGRIQMDKMAGSQVNLSQLKNGHYILWVNDRYHSKFIKQ